MIRLRCSLCGKAFAVKDELAGRTISCPDCKIKIKVPGMTSPDATSQRGGESQEMPRSSSPLLQDAIQTQSPPPPRPRPIEVEDADEDEEYEPRQRGRRKPRRMTTSSGGGLTYFGIYLIVVMFLFLALVGLCFLAPKEAYIIAFAIGITGALWFVGVAFNESPLQGLACLFIPFYFVLFLVSHYEDAKSPFYLMVGSSLCVSILVLVVERVETSPIPAPDVGPPIAIAPLPVKPVEMPEKPKDIIKPRPKPFKPLPPDAGSAEPGLRAHWSFDEGAGILAKDSGPHDLEATLHGCTWVPGVRGKAVQLNGATDYVELSSSNVLSFASNAPFTVAGWLKTSKAKGFALSLRPQKDAPYDMLNITFKEGKLAVQIRHQGDPFYPNEAICNVPIHDNRWHHFAVTRRVDGEVSLFVDGKYNARATGPRGSRGLPFGMLVTSNRVIGAEAMLIVGERHSYYDPSRLEGCIDELYFFGDALGEAEIRKLR